MMNWTTLLSISCLLTLRRLPTTFAETYYTGPEEVISDFCPDGTICQNGSTCIKLEKGISTKHYREYTCDCSKTVGVAAYAGYECEYSAMEYCLLGSAQQTTEGGNGAGGAGGAGYSFCTNGECSQIWMPDLDEEIRHKGCDCNSGFEGDYCEYIYGEGPVWKTNTGAAISWVISIVVFGIVAVSIKIYHAKQSRENDQRKIQFTAAPADLNDDDDDLEMVHDGEEDYKCQNKEIS